MMYALVVTVLTLLGTDAKAVQHVDWYSTPDGCELARRLTVDLIRKEQPAAQLVIGCVPVERKVVS